MFKNFRFAGACVVSLSAFALSPSAQGQQVTSLSMTSDAGDYVGQGLTYFLTPTDGTFSASVNSGGGVSIAYQGFTPGDFWNLDFAAPNNQPLTVGTYLNATRFPFEVSSVPGLAVYGDGRGCNNDNGSFQVLQIVYGPNNTVSAFDATFEQHCEGAVPALRGEIRYNANVVVAVTAPTHIQVVENQNVMFTVTGVDAQARRVVLTASNLPAGATFTDLQNSTGSFSWTPTSAQAGTYIVTFIGDNQAGNTSTASTQIVVIPPPPANDDIASVTRIASIPNSASQDATTATSSPSDPWCYGNNQSVWFTYTPTVNERLEANTFGSNYDTTLSVYTGSPGNLTQMGCNDDAGGTVQSRVRFDATAGTQYYFMVGSLYPQSPANLVFNLQLAPPPFTFTPSIAQFGSVRASTGVVTISGSVTCNANSFVTLFGQIKQTRGGAPISGFFSAFVSCDSTTVSWSTTVQSQTQLFHGRAAALFAAGKASITATAFGFDPDTGEFKQVDISTSVTLRGAQ